MSREAIVNMGGALAKPRKGRPIWMNLARLVHLRAQSVRS
jgi:hypothetical protein